MADLTITEVAKKYNLKPDTLRYYERIGLLPTIPRQKNGNRYYPADIQNWLEMVICLRHSGVSIETLLDYANLLRQGDATLQAREELLKEQLEELKDRRYDLDRSISRLEHKISLYESGEINQHKNYFTEYRIMEDDND